MSNVTATKPSVSGGIWVAPLGSTLPEDATTALNDAFKSLGYVSEDGLSNTNTPSSDDVKDWGGNVVLTMQADKEDTFTFKLIEALNIDVLKTVFGSDNVTGTLATGITIKANASEIAAQSYVIEMVQGNALHRIVIPEGKISEIGEFVYKGNEATGYELTIKALPDEEANTHYEYIKTK